MDQSQNKTKIDSWVSIQYIIYDFSIWNTRKTMCDKNESWSYYLLDGEERARG